MHLAKSYKSCRKASSQWEAKKRTYLVDVRMDKGNIVIAGDTVAQRIQPLIYSLDNHLVRKTVSHMHELCTFTRNGQGRTQYRAKGSLWPMPCPNKATAQLHKLCFAR